MNKTLFLSTLVCISCMAASQLLFGTDENIPKPSPIVDKCMAKLDDIMMYGCIEPSSERWMPSNFTTNGHNSCCYIFEVADCFFDSLKAPHKCTPEERNATYSYIEEALDMYIKDVCHKHLPKSKCYTIEKH